MRHNIFCYGTLLFPQVFETVVGANIQSQACVLPGFERRRIAGHVYPGIVEKRRSTVAGFLYKGLTQCQLHRLDQYEGDEYLRELVMVRDEHSRYYSAWVYVIQPKYSNMLSDDPWDAVEFEKLFLSDYLANLNRASY